MENEELEGQNAAHLIGFAAAGRCMNRFFVRKRGREFSILHFQFSIETVSCFNFVVTFQRFYTLRRRVALARHLKAVSVLQVKGLFCGRDRFLGILNLNDAGDTDFGGGDH